MANECVYCEQRHIETNMLVLNGGDLWIEFCEPCGERETMTNQDGQTLSVAAIFRGEKPAPPSQAALDYRAQFGVVKPSDLPRRERRARSVRPLRTRLGPLLDAALS